MKITHILILFISFNTFSQQWAPLGATWHYTHNTVWSPPPNSFSNKYEVTGDTLINGKLCSIIEKEYLTTDNRPDTEYMYQENDTVFFYDTTFAEFQVLYDFNAVVDDFWYIKVMDYDDPGDIDSVKVTVTAFDYVDVNGNSLKRMEVDYSYIYENPTQSNSGTIIQSMGDLLQMFNYNPYDGSIVDGPYSSGLRCYDDTIIGHYEAPGVNGNCEFVAGIENEKVIEIEFYPNPTSDFVEIKGINGNYGSIRFHNIGGKLVLEKKFKPENVVDISDLEPGIYLVKMADADGNVFTGKIVKK